MSYAASYVGDLERAFSARVAGGLPAFCYAFSVSVGPRDFSPYVMRRVGRRFRAYMRGCVGVFSVGVRVSDADRLKASVLGGQEVLNLVRCVVVSPCELDVDALRVRWMDQLGAVGFSARLIAGSGALVGDVGTLLADAVQWMCCGAGQKLRQVVRLWPFRRGAPGAVWLVGSKSFGGARLPYSAAVDGSRLREAVAGRGSSAGRRGRGSKSRGILAEVDRVRSV